MFHRTRAPDALPCECLAHTRSSSSITSTTCPSPRAFSDSNQQNIRGSATPRPNKHQVPFSIASPLETLLLAHEATERRQVGNNPRRCRRGIPRAAAATRPDSGQQPSNGIHQVTCHKARNLCWSHQGKAQRPVGNRVIDLWILSCSTSRKRSVEHLEWRFESDLWSICCSNT